MRLLFKFKMISIFTFILIDYIKCLGPYQIGIVEDKDSKINHFIGHTVSNPDVLVISKDGDMFALLAVPQKYFNDQEQTQFESSEESGEQEKTESHHKNDISNVNEGIKLLRNETVTIQLIKDYESRLKTLKASYLSNETKRLFAGDDIDVAITVKENAKTFLEKKEKKLYKLNELASSKTTDNEIEIERILNENPSLAVYSPVKSGLLSQQFKAVMTEGGFHLLNVKGECLTRDKFDLSFSDCTRAITLRLLKPKNLKINPLEREKQKLELQKALKIINAGIKQVENDAENFRSQQDKILLMSNKLKEEKSQNVGITELSDDELKINNNDLTELRMQLNAKIANTENKSLGLSARKSLIEKIAGADKKKNE